jgi:hypothetical protein
VRVRAGVAACGANPEPVQVGFPRDLVGLDEVAGGQVMVAQGEAGAAVLVVERDQDTGASRREGLAAGGGLVVQDVPGGFVVGPSPR